MDYGFFRSLADSLVRMFGNSTSVTFWRYPDDTYDPLTGGDSGEPVPYSVVGVQLPTGINDISTPPDDLARNRSMKLIVPALGLPIVPRDGDEVAVPGHEGRFVVTAAKPTQPDGQHIFFTVMIERRGDRT